MKRYLILTTAAAILFQQNAFGGWTSGGGQLRTVADNPWFIQNTKQVSYCVKIDEVNFGQSLEIAKVKIEEAIQYWKNQFAMAIPEEHYNTPKIYLGTQEFRETACDSKVDITFQFGILDTKQENFLKDPTKIVGVAVQTDYDEVTLHGKGFVYISPEYGRLALPEKEAIPGRWGIGNGRLLKLMLVHEMGHIFGLPHDIGKNKDFTIMGTDFPKTLVSGFGRWLANSNTMPEYFGGFYEQGMEYCAKETGEEDPMLNIANAAKVFGIPHGWKCLKILGGVDSTFKVYAAQRASDSYQFIGNAHSYFGLDGENGGTAEVYLSPNQRVFPDLGGVLPTYYRGRLVNYAEFVNSDTKTKSQIIVTRTPFEFLVAGAGDQERILQVANIWPWINFLRPN